MFVYSGGKLIAEYSTTPPPAPPNATTRYTITDQLGSPRVILDSAGDVVSRRDFLPFGEEINPDGIYRTDALKYGRTDNVRQKFTGYQNDEETGLDFAEARMYESRHGRFTAVDPLLASGKSADPQTFNRYVYVLNRPLALKDPTGLCDAPVGLQKGQVGFCFEAFIRAKRIGPGGIAHGDGREHTGTDRNAGARVTVWGMASTTASDFDVKKVGERTQASVVGDDLNASGTVTGPDGSVFRTDINLPGSISVSGDATTNVTWSNNNMKKGETDFGDGFDVTLSISNGRNGFQKLGQDTQAEGAATGGPPGGATIVIGKAIEWAAPAGTIDGNATLRVSGNGDVTWVGGATRGYPSYAVYAYTVGDDGKPKVVFSRTRDETKIEELTKPMTSW